MARKVTKAPNAAATTDAANKGEENLNPDEDDEDEDEILDPKDAPKDDEDEDDDDDSDEDDDADLDKEFEELHGFPPRTPEKDMTVEQALAYNKFNMKKWQKRAQAATKAFDGLTPEELQRLKDVEVAHTELLNKKPEESDTDKAVESAKAEVRNKYVPLLLASKLNVLTDGRHTDEKLNRMVSRMRLDDFVKDDGDFDEDAIKEFAEDFLSVSAPTKRRNGTDHLGHRNHEGAPPVSDAELGRQRALARTGRA